MSQVKLTLRPPPNVDFIHGYPGIPPKEGERPQAAVKGAIEVRVGPQGVKAQWVRIELRKVETLPGGGQGNTYFDFVGPSPVNLWQSSDEYAILQTQDFPFYIRIPESIPPSIALEKGAGIKYELIATVCVKGKKGWFRRRKSIVAATAAGITIDKHELHSTWPVYQQPESRHLKQDGVELTVDRAQTCYGPGDRVVVYATLRSDALATVILRGFEFTLVETSVFRAGPNAQKKAQPVVKQQLIGDQKVPVNATMYGGNKHKAELACTLPRDHTTTSLSSARHIDITYNITVKALMGTGTSLIMDLPVVISNWPRNVSQEAIRRIGNAPSLSLMPAHTPGSPTRPNQRSLSPMALSGTSPGQYTNTGSLTGAAQTAMNQGGRQQGQFNTAPANGNASSSYQVDEYGYNRDSKAPFGTAPPNTNANNAAASRVARPIDPRRPRSASNTNRFTVTNMVDDGEVSSTGHQRQGSSGGPQRAASATVSAPKSQWLSAEEEKKRLYDQATARVQQVQGSVASLDESPPPGSSSYPPAQVDAGPIIPASSPPRQNGSRWETAEEEKQRLYNEAQARAKVTQGASMYSPEATGSGSGAAPHRTLSAGSQTAGAGMSSGAALYQQAMSSRSRAAVESHLPSPPPTTIDERPSTATVPHYPSAEEEKAALKRYHEAKNAVDRNQNTNYESYPPAGFSYGSTPASAYPSPPAGSPPPFDGPSTVQQPHTGAMSASAEKEQVRRAFEARDAAAARAAAPVAQASSPPGYSPPPTASGSGSSHPILNEKEQLRRKYEEEDRQAQLAKVNGGVNAPPRNASLSGAGGPPPPGFRPASRDRPSPPGASGSKPLSALEEKQMLKARYEAENNAAAGPPPMQSPAYDYQPYSPPPLMPRPPQQYIHETQAEDARMSQMGVSDAKQVNGTHELDLRPFTPFSTGFQQPDAKSPPPPPPLPPKAPGS